MNIASGLVTAGAGRPPRACDPEEHCITCGDVAVPMHVLEVDANDRLGWCSETVDPSSPTEIEVVDFGLIGEVGRGDVVLVHAGTALVHLSTGQDETGT